MPYHRSEEHTSELQSHDNLVCRLLLEKKKQANAARQRKSCMTHVSTHTGARCSVATCCVLCSTLFERAPLRVQIVFLFFFFFNDPPPPEISPLSLPDPLPI